MKTGLEPLEQMILGLKEDLKFDKLSDGERDQVYDIIGSLKICMPVVQTVLEHPPVNLPHPVFIPSFSNVSTFMVLTLQKFMDLKQGLIQHLSENKIAPEHHESAYTLIGSINLCLPILKGADVLSKKLKDEKSPIPSQKSSISLDTPGTLSQED